MRVGGLAPMTEDIHPEDFQPDSRREPSLRERKFAKTKLALLRAVVDRLRVKSLDQITVKELCEAAEVSEATFFNYFPKKDDLLHYFIQLWTVEVMFQAEKAAGADAGLTYIEQVFDYTGRQLGDHPRLMLEIIGRMALEPPPAECVRRWGELSRAERLQAFPDLEGVDCCAERGLRDVFRPALQRAVEHGELPVDVDVEIALLALLSTFFGVPLWLGTQDPARIRPAYERQLRLIWAGLRAEKRP
jgi:AcrR family transcriptional regulator